MRRASGRWLLAIVALAAVLRAADLGTQSFWFDESYTVHGVGGSFSGLVHRIGTTESTPPLYYALAWVWRHVFGLGEAGLRSLSTLFGIGLIPVVYAIARRLASERVALVAAALAATSPELVWMSQEARSYALMVLLDAASVLAFLVARERPGARTLLAWSSVAAAALATHYFAVFLVGAELCWLAVELRRRVAVALPIPLVTAGALLPLALHQRAHTAFLATGGQSLATRVSATPKIFLVGQSASAFDAWLVVGAMAALVALGLALAAARPARGRIAAVAAIAAAALAAPVVLAVAGADYVNARNLLGAWPLVLVVAAAGLAGSLARRAGLAAAAALCACGGGVTIAIDSTGRLQRDDWRAAAADIRATTSMGAVVLLDPAGGSAPLSLYLRVAPLPRAGERVRELDVMTLTRGRSGPDFVPPPPFAPAARVSAPSFRLVRYVAPAPARVTPAALAARADRLGLAPPEPVRRRR